MQNYEQIITNNSEVKGFLVNFNWNEYYVPVSKLKIGSYNLCFDGEYVKPNYEHYKGKNFWWGSHKKEILFKKINSVIIKEVTEVPDWVGKDKNKVLEEIEAYKKECKKECKKNCLFNRVLRFFIKKIRKKL